MFRRLTRLASLIATGGLLVVFEVGCTPASKPPAGVAATPSAATAKPAVPAPPASGSPFKIERKGRPITAGGPHLDGAEAGHGASPEPGMETACPLFEDLHAALGLDFTYSNGEAGESLMVEAIGGGVGWLDYDCDGHWDLYFTQGGDPAAADRSGQPIDRLFRQLPGELPGGASRFVDVTEASLIREPAYSQGVAIGDFDNDGFDDIYVTNVGRNTLFQNLGDGTFGEVTDSAGVGDERWSSSAAWADLDLDGDLDLYVCNYLKYDPLHPMDCRNVRGEARICHPRDVEHWPDECYLNQGDGTFRPVAAERGLFGPGNKALGVVVADFTNDRRPDIYVANDTTANFLFVNQGEGRFQESAVLLGCAVDRNGMAQASMGLAVGDYDGNGWLDIYSTHFYDESNTLYRNLGNNGFEDVTGIVGLHEPTLPRLGFGTAMADFNQDGRQELLIANGHIENFPGNPLLRMKPQLFSFDGTRFRDCSTAAGGFFQERQVGRGVALADYDGDGDLDAAVVHQNTPAALLENRSQRGHFLAVRFIGVQSNRRGIGCRVTVTSADGQWVQELCGGSSFASSHQPQLIVGLGERAGPCSLQVLWPSGLTQSLSDVLPDRLLVIREPSPERP